MDNIQQLVQLKELAKGLPNIKGRGPLLSTLKQNIHFCRTFKGGQKLALSFYRERHAEYTELDRRASEIVREKQRSKRK